MRKKVVLKPEIGNRVAAILLIGPTGSGKTPLGAYFEKNGFFGRRCIHFDFGANLRKVAGRRERPRFLGALDFATVKNVLLSGRLLAGREFHVAHNIMAHFLKMKKAGEGDVLVLNGLPRHTSQADDIATIADVRLVINLKCSAGVVVGRIKNNTGGDRNGRQDDSVPMVRKKLEIFRRRTFPLLDHYRREKVMILNVNIARLSDSSKVADCIEIKHCNAAKLFVAGSARKSRGIRWQ